MTSPSWRQLGAAPHRLMFFLGAFQAAGVMLWWLGDLLGRYTQAYAAPSWTIPAAWAHAFLMIYGFFPFFIFGFLMTTFPNWLNGRPVTRWSYLPASILMAGGMLLFYAGLVIDKLLLLVGVLLFLAGWGIGLLALLAILRQSQHPDKQHSRVTIAGLFMGWLGACAYGLWLFTGAIQFLNFSRIAGIWFFLLPIFLTVSHRMIPFFSSRVLTAYVIYRPDWILPAMLACATGHGLLELLGLDAWRGFFDLPFLALAAWLSYRWDLLRSFQVRLLAVLHIAFFWLAIALAFYSFQDVALLFDHAGDFTLGFAPLHALGIGFFAAMMLAMASRVTLGHSGRPLAADALTWTLFLGLQAAAVLRILPDIGLSIAPGLIYPLAASVWLFSIVSWIWKYGLIYWQPRVDGKSG
ncbi:NnrS family protein [Thermithiobacillus plumbiphilus]|uniref:NnrS family protein n=1 Tax=Thermithiobacillus plumbiphilus TaxID=1729899 RepID=A0ABU9DDQ6_9PROT